MPELDDLKNSLRIDGNDDDFMLKNYLAAAGNYIKGAIGTDNDTFYSETDVKTLYDVAVLALASSYYNYRSSAVSVSVTTVNLPVNSIIGQLRGRYDLFTEKGDDDGESS